MNAGAGPEFPEAGVRLVVHRPGALTYLFERGEIVLGRLAEQALVEEGLGVGKDDLTIGVVLDLGVGGIADPHRSHPPVARQTLRLPLIDRKSTRLNSSH